MAWAVDAVLGTAAPANSSSGALTTSAAAASGTWISLSTGNWTAGQPTSVSGGGLSWGLVSQVSNGSLSNSLYRAYAASGLASGTTITVAWGSATTEIKISAVSFSGGEPGSEIENTANATGSAVGWSVDPTADSNNALVVCSAALNTNNSNTPDANTTEDTDFQFPGGSCATISHRVVSATGSNPVGGTWGSAAAWGASAGSFMLTPPPPGPIMYLYKPMRSRR